MPPSDAGLKLKSHRVTTGRIFLFLGRLEFNSWTTLVNSELFANCFGFLVCFTWVTCFSYLPRSSRLATRKSALHPFLLCERLILRQRWAIKEWTLLFWTISVRYDLKNYENRGGCYRSYYGVRTPPKFMVWFSTQALEFYSWFQNFTLFLIIGKRFYTSLLTFELNFFIWPCSLYIFISRCQIAQSNRAIFNSTNNVLHTATFFPC